MKKSLMLSLSIITATILLSGCGGDSRSSSSLFKKADPAPVTVSSGKEIAKNVAAGKSSSGLGGLDMNSEGADKAIDDASSNTAMLSNIMVQLAKDNSKKTTHSLNQAIDNKSRCDSGGTIRVSGDATQTKMSLVATYKDCNTGSYTFNGSMEIDMKMENSTTIEYMNIEFPSDFYAETSLQKIKYFKDSKIEMNNISGNNLDMTNTIKVDIDGKLYGSYNSKWHLTGDSMYQTSGKEYIDNLGSYVTYDESYDMSDTPFRYNSSGLKSGEAHYIGANGGKIILKAQNGQLVVKVDSDNDGVFESEEVVSN